MKCFKKACRGEKGFTLIELLVVIMILGVLAAVVTLAVTRFIGKGTLESANAELVTVQAAVEACLAEANSARLRRRCLRLDRRRGYCPGGRQRELQRLPADAHARP